MNLTPEEKAVGQDNYHAAVGGTRRDFLKEVVATGAVSGMGLGAMYFGYDRDVGDPVRIGIIGTGDEGGVLIGAMTPKYVDVVGICDIRPFNIHRAFYGDWSSENAAKVRPGLIQQFDYSDRAAADAKITVYENYEDLLDRSDIEGVIIALPLHLHAKVAIAAMRKGKHVLTEKLMAHNVGQCKDMARVARRENQLLATGHQRHYSVLYDNAKHLLQWGLLGELHHIRAQWHRGNLPDRDSWKQPLPGGEIAFDASSNKVMHVDKIQKEIKSFTKRLAAAENAGDFDKANLYRKRLAQWEIWDSDKDDVDAKQYGYIDEVLPNGRQRSALEELCRWRLWQRTGGGLMAELGSHQLDAASIFISCLKGGTKKVHPLTVHAVGGRHLFPLDRHAGDHVYCMFEFPGPGYDYDFNVGYRYADEITRLPDPEMGIPNYEQDPNKKIVVTYSSIMGNGFGGYGEIVMGTRGTMVIEQEKEVMLYKGHSTSTQVKVRSDQGGPTLDTTESMAPEAVVSKVATQGPPSRGYTEEIEHWAWCIRNRDPENQPRCHPEVALGDAVIALGSTLAIQNSEKGGPGYLQFKPEWFSIDSDETPDGSRPTESI